MGRTQHSQVILAKVLRHNLTQPETILWAKLREVQSAGLTFRRQQPIGDYVVDFVSFNAHLIIEIDGSQHNALSNKEQDEHRTKWLKSQGFRVLRFWNNDVLADAEGIVNIILEHAKK